MGLTFAQVSLFAGGISEMQLLTIEGLLEGKSLPRRSQ